MGVMGQKICLSMIVKNEAPVISRCLASVIPIIDYWVIVDTGSDDGTQEAIRDFMRAIPGELHQRPWVDFAHNRTEALHLAKPHGHYTLIIDADDVLELAPKFRMPFLNADSYTLEIRHWELLYWRAQLVRSSLPWRYEGVLHEFLSCGFDAQNRRIFSENRSQKQLSGVGIRMTEGGARRRVSAAERYSRDAAVLEKAEELKDLCKQYDVNMGLVIESGRSTLAWFRVQGDDRRTMDFWATLDWALGQLTKGAMRLIFFGQKPPSEESEPVN